MIWFEDDGCHGSMCRTKHFSAFVALAPFTQRLAACDGLAGVK